MLSARIIFGLNSQLDKSNRDEKAVFTCLKYTPKNLHLGKQIAVYVCIFNIIFVPITVPGWRLGWGFLWKRCVKGELWGGAQGKWRGSASTRPWQGTPGMATSSCKKAVFCTSASLCQSVTGQGRQQRGKWADSPGWPGSHLATGDYQKEDAVSCSQPRLVAGGACYSRAVGEPSKAPKAVHHFKIAIELHPQIKE